jgi:hypothetical protein
MRFQMQWFRFQIVVKTLQRFQNAVVSLPKRFQRFHRFQNASNMYSFRFHRFQILEAMEAK